MIDEVPEAPPSQSHAVRNVVLAIAAIYVIASLYLMWDMHGRLAKVEATTATNYDKLSRKIAENEASAKASQQAIAKQVGMTEEQLARRTAELQRQQRAAESKLIEQGQQIGQVTGEVAGVKGEVAGVKGDVGTVRTDLETTKGKLERAIGDLGQQSGLIARTRDDLEVLKHKGSTPVSTVSLQLKKTDPKRGKFTLNVIADDRTIEKKDRNIYEPLQFYTGRDRLLYELVVFTVAKDKVSGYISTPKNAPTPAPTGGN